MRNLTFFQKCQQIGDFLRNQRKRYLEFALNACQISRPKRHVALCINLTPLNATMRVRQPTTERQRACIDLVYLAMVSQSFVCVQNSLFTFDSIRLTKPLSPRFSVQTLLSNLPHIPCLKRNTIQVK